MKKFKQHIIESSGAVHKVVWNGKDGGTAILMVPAKEFKKDQDLASLKVLKQKVPGAKALTRLKAEQNPITTTDYAGTKEFRLVHVDFKTKIVQSEAADNVVTATQKTKEKHEREKEQLRKRQEFEKERARETDFRAKENKRKLEMQRKEAEKRSKQVNEYLEDGTDELVKTYKKDTPGQT